MSKSIVAITVCLTALAFCPAASADDVAVIVGFHGQADSGIFGRHGGRPGTDLSSLNAHAGHVPAARLAALRAEEGVAYVEEDAILHATYEPNDTYYATDPSSDPSYNQQRPDFALIRCPEAWDVSRGALKRVAVLDTGCQLNHPDIGSGASGKVKAWKNFTTGKATDVSDMNGHGTHTAGTVGARANNARGVAGAGLDCELAIGKVLGNSGSGSTSGVAAGIDWSRTTAGAKVISMSLGGPGSITLEAAVNNAWNAGLVIVAAAGNSGNNSPSYPGAYANCIAVAATDAGGVLASFSTFGDWVDIAGPGVNILSTWKGSGYAWSSGTSMATPHVAGVAALIWASTQGTTNANVRARIETTATLPVTGTNAGTLKVLDAKAAVSP